MDGHIANEHHTAINGQQNVTQHQQTHPRHYGNGYYEQTHQQQRAQLNHSYDPNMCTTAARFSESFYLSKSVTTDGTTLDPPPPPLPTATNHHHTEEELLGYNNVILLHETAHDIGAEAIVTNSETLEEAPRPTIPLQTLQAQLHMQEGTFVSNYQYMNVHYEQTALAHETASSTHVAGMLVHRSPNGHLYQQNYLVNTEHVTAKDSVEYVQIQTQHADANVTFVTEAAADAGHERGHLNSFELSNQYDDFQHAAHAVDENSAELIAQYAADLANVTPDERHLTAPNKDEQRLLLESTMSPLLAAVNDITKRDAELQLYLSQNLEKDSTQYLSKGINRCEETHIEKATTPNESAQNSSDEDDYLLVSDKAVECRAKASLPTNYLYFGEVDTNKTSEPCVFAKKPIPRRTMFGPYEGQVVYVSEIDLDVLHVQIPRCNPMLMLDDSHILDVSKEDASNWMRYIPLAQTYAQQNLQLLHEDGKLFLRCVRDIRINEELRVGYHSAYAERFLLPKLQPTAADLKDEFYRKHPWKCFECKQRFANSAEMKLHLNEHDEPETPQRNKETQPEQTKKNVKKLTNTQAKSCLVRISADSRRCHICGKVFMTNETLRQHFTKQHKDQHAKVNFLNRKSIKKSPKSVQLKESKYMYKCNLCAKRFHKESLLAQHKSTHNGNSKKPHQCHICQQRCATPAALAAHLQGHEAVQYTCVFCEQKFKYVRDFKKHVAVHKTGSNEFFECPNCKKQYADYHLVRKHVRIFHSNREFFCASCGKKFHNSYALQRHKLTHMESKNFACTSCSKQFGRKDHLLIHTKRKHSPNIDKTSSQIVQTSAEIKANDASSPAETTKKSLSPAVKSSKESTTPPTNSLTDGTQYLKMSPMKPPPSTITTTATSSSNRRKQTPTKLKALELNADTVTFVALSEMLSPFIISESALNADFKIPTRSKSNVDTAAAASEAKSNEKSKSNKSTDTHLENGEEKNTNSNVSKTEAAVTTSTVPSPLYPFSCHICPHSSFKRRGMLVNHLAKVHPTVNMEQLEALKAPIVKQLLIFPCPYCSNVYKLNAKRKGHIIKHHPGRELPASMRKTRAQAVEVAQSADVPQAALAAHSAEVAATVGTLEVNVHKCERCYKQYAARSRLLSHYRKAHPEQVDLPVKLSTSEECSNRLPDFPTPNGELLQQHTAPLEVETNIIPYQLQSPVSPENKLLKLSSAAALELSRFDDDFFNVPMRCTNDEEVVVPTVFADQATHNNLQHLPALFEESSIVGINATSMEKYNRSIETQFFEKITKFS